VIKLRFPKPVNKPAIRLGLAAILFFVSIFFIKCDGREGTATLPSCTGKPGEILLVIDTTTWNSPFGDSLRSCFMGTVPGLPEREPFFDVVRIVPRAFTDIFKTTGNILVVETDAGKKAGFLEKENLWAKNQLYVKLLANNNQEGGRIIGKNKEYLRSIFLKAGFQRIKKTIAKTVDPEISETTKKTIGIKLKLPKGFSLVKKNSGAIYYRRDLKIGEHSVIQGIMAYKFPYTDTANLFLKNMMDSRDSLTKNLIKGSQEAYFMEIFRLYEPDTLETRIRDFYAKEMKGLWRMNGEFMGGPFFSYFTVDENSGNIYVIDGFVYAPKFTKRRYVRELEAMAQMTDFQ